MTTANILFYTKLINTSIGFFNQVTSLTFMSASLSLFLNLLPFCAVGILISMIRVKLKIY